MPHEMAPPQPTPDELANRLLEEHAGTEIQFHGKTMAFGQFVQLRAALCPVKPGELGAASDTEFMVNVLTDSKVELSEEYQSYIRQPETVKPESSRTESEPAKTDVINLKKESAEIVKPAADNSKTSHAIDRHRETEVRISPKIHPEIMARVVKFETKPVVNKVIVETIKSKEPIPEKKSVTDKPVNEIVTNVPVSLIETADRPLNINPESIEDTQPQPVILPNSEILLDQPDQEAVTLPLEAESSEIVVMPDIGTDIETTVTDLIETSVSEDSITERSPEATFSDTIEQFESFEQAEKEPAVIIAEFMLQVLPAVTQEVYERVQEMEPEAAAEVSAQIETISIVADRLHELVVHGKTEGEEAKQIEAYLKREYELLLVAIGIEPTEQIINDFIKYIYSAEYQIREEINLREIEIIDEGTHEKKLFDEQGVFSRAHTASLNLSRRLDKSIGQLVVNYFSS